MAFQLIGAPIALYSEFETGAADKAVAALRKELGLKFPGLRLNNFTQEQANDKIRNKAKAIWKSGLKPFFIGGDHSITLPILQGNIKPFDVFWFDAHADAYDVYKGSLSHATVLRRVSELHHCRNIYLIGYRFKKIKEEVEFLKNSKRVHVIKASEIKKMRSKRYYVTIDIDVLDPVYAPGVDHPVPKGMKPNQLIKAIRHLKKGNIIGADLVEVVPDNDYTGITTHNAAEIIKEFLE